jgi:hypothetical protein
VRWKSWCSYRRGERYGYSLLTHRLRCQDDRSRIDNRRVLSTTKDTVHPNTSKYIIRSSYMRNRPPDCVRVEVRDGVCVGMPPPTRYGSTRRWKRKEETEGIGMGGANATVALAQTESTVDVVACASVDCFRLGLLSPFGSPWPHQRPRGLNRHRPQQHDCKLPRCKTTRLWRGCGISRLKLELAHAVRCVMQFGLQFGNHIANVGPRRCCTSLGFSIDVVRDDRRMAGCVIGCKQPKSFQLRTDGPAWCARADGSTSTAAI